MTSTQPIWSYSRQTTFENCPQSYRLQYIDRVPQIDNAYSQYGTLCHEIQEQWADGRLQSFELADTFQEGFDQTVLSPFPPYPRGLGQKYYDAGFRYFSAFDGFGDQYEILSVEDKFETRIRGHAFTGIADLVLRDRDSSEITVVDHKTASLATMNKDLSRKKRQLYVYAAHVKEKFCEYPACLRFNLLREGAFIDEPFDMAAYNETGDWIGETIRAIQTETEWPAKSPDYFCRFICGVNEHCPVGRRSIESR